MRGTPAGVLIKMVHWNPVAIAGMRSAIAFLLILAAFGRPRFTWKFAQIAAAVSYCATVILFVVANKLTTAANAILLQYSAPVFVAVLSGKMLNEKVKRSDYVTIVVILGGMALFFVDQLDTHGLWGNVAALVSGVTFAFLVIFLRMQKDEDPINSVLLGNALTAVISVPFMFIGPAPDALSWVGFAFLGVFQLGLSYILYVKAIKHVSALEATLIPVLEPLLNPVFVLLMTGETPGFFACIGGAVVLIGVTVNFGLRAAVEPHSENGNGTSVKES